MVEWKVGLECKWKEWKVRCDGHNREGACVKIKCFCEGQRFKWSWALSHASKNHVCGSVKFACLCERALCSVYT